MVFTQAILEHGRKSALLRHWWFSWQHRLGLLRRWRAVDWKGIERLVFVCRGNICRSAYAEALARAAGLPAASCGLQPGEPGPAHEVVIDCSNESVRPLLREHQSQALFELDLTPADLLIAMEPSQCRELARRTKGVGAPITLLGLWASPPRPHIEDPFGLSRDYFLRCMGVIDDAVGNLGRTWRQHRAGADASSPAG
jgi:protein-tyrosine phosphatase